jgi:hypothetical protein
MIFFRFYLVITILFILIFSCKTKPEKNPQLIEKNPNNPYTSCQLIEKEFINKAGKIQSFKEYYLRCSIEDYFIKLCENKVEKSELIKYLNKGITVEMEIKEGMWDHCNENIAYAQSRTGKYVIIKKIIK